MRIVSNPSYLADRCQWDGLILGGVWWLLDGRVVWNENAYFFPSLLFRFLFLLSLEILYYNCRRYILSEGRGTVGYWVTRFW
ncbi:hypothetical protein BDV35DRAFT_338146 [Aspergillus flavus]|uniref:Uncharacterized protein n=1 Tax=Aspergillus flavus TaxID=5059 RepID=A0A5N6HAZ6_ASPFL|nr:hypothetical protein BDV35DRAFT_338146 [Aspergillus flavus]